MNEMNCTEKIVKDPIIKPINSINDLIENELRNTLVDEYSKKILLSFPVVYVHSKKDANKYNFYVGESNNVIERTKQHLQKKEEKETWQRKMFASGGNDLKMFIIGHEHFNKSLTLDIENKMIQYVCAMSNTNVVYNGRGNPQGSYYPKKEVEIIFEKIWNKLHKDNGKIFQDMEEIKNSAIFKASPFHELNEEQTKAKNAIIEAVDSAIRNKNKKYVIIIQGEAGSGKTVVNSSAFFEMIIGKQDEREIITEKRNCYMIVNHEEQFKVYEEIAKKLGIQSGHVQNPSAFINNCYKEKINNVDVAFVDEAHLLETRHTRGYHKIYDNKQLNEILKVAKVTVLMFDKNQLLRSRQFIKIDEMTKELKAKKYVVKTIDLKPPIIDR